SDVTVAAYPWGCYFRVVIPNGVFRRCGWTGRLTALSEFTIITIDTPSLGDRTYFVHDGEIAFVVDPQRDVDRVMSLLGQEQVRLTHIFETHIHNDYVTGGLALSRRTGAAYHVNAED